MLFKVTPASATAMRKAAAVVDSIDDGALVEITRDGDRIVVMQILGPDGKVPECADEVFAAAFPLTEGTTKTVLDESDVTDSELIKLSYRVSVLEVEVSGLLDEVEDLKKED